MPSHEEILIRSARLVETSRDLVLEWERGRSSDLIRLEQSAVAIDQSWVMVAETDEAILKSGTDWGVRASR